MSTYSTWEYYSTTHHGTAAENEYLRLAHKAAGEINNRTFERAAFAREFMKIPLCNCECELVDALHTFEKTAVLVPEGIASISNDGLSVTVDTNNALQNSRLAAMEHKAQSICRKHLLRPVNLLYAGVAAW